MEKIIKWGIIGAGNIANRFAEAVKNIEGAELTSVASRSEETGRSFAQKHNIKNVFIGYDEMAKSDLVDAVYIATPHPMHKPCAETFINAKKHVLCEKPVCVNSKDAIALKKCAEENGVFLMEAMWTRFLPAIKEAVSIANSGEIGEVRGVKADFCCSFPYDAKSRIYNSDLAGGALLDVGIYGLNFAAIFLGDKTENVFSTADVNHGVDYQTNVLIKYENGTIASVSSAVNVVKPIMGYIYGTKGYIELPQFFCANEIVVDVNNKKTHILKPYMGNGFEEEIIEACNCIRSGKIQSDIMSMSESIRILEQMDYIRQQIGLKYPFEE